MHASDLTWETASELQRAAITFTMQRRPREPEDLDRPISHARALRALEGLRGRRFPDGDSLVTVTVSCRGRVRLVRGHFIPRQSRDHPDVPWTDNSEVLYWTCLPCTQVRRYAEGPQEALDRALRRVLIP